MKRNPGFTLIELSLAIAMMSMMMVVTYNSIGHAVRVRAAVEERGRVVRAGQAFFDRLERELSAVYHVPVQRSAGAGRAPASAPPPTTSPAAATETTPTIVTTGVSRTTFVGVSAEGAGVPRDGLVFSCLCGEVWTFGLADTTRIPHAEVAYDFLYDSEERRTFLMRREDGTLDDLPADGGFRDAVWPTVRGLNLRYLDPRDKQWKDAWDADGRPAESALPRAIEVTLWLGAVEEDGDEVADEGTVVLARTIELVEPATVGVRR